MNTDEAGIEPVASSETAYVQEALGWMPKEDFVPLLDGSASRDGCATDNVIGELTDRPLILFADDNADMREYICNLLAWRFRFISVGNGKAALDEALKRKPDLILTDVMMPEMDGFEMLAALRKDPATRTIPVIMLSARAGEESRIDGLDRGADDYLTKPFAARELVARVEAQLKMTRLRKDAQEQEAALNLEIQHARRFAWELLEHIPDAFCTLDGDFRITYANRAASTLVQVQAYLGACLWELYPALLGTEVETNLRRAMNQRVSMEFEHYFHTDEKDSWFKFLVYPSHDDGIILYLRDTTTAQKTEEALRSSEKLAAAGRLAASIAHEINNPLEAVTNLLFLAKLDESLTNNTKSLLEVADRELQRLSHIAARSLKFYRQRTAPALTSIEELLESVLFFNDPDMRIRAIRLERRHRPAPPVLCLPGEIQQVITNLIANAMDAVAQRGRLVVAVRPSTDRTGRKGVVLTVADQGIGMERKTMDRLFHPFVTTKGEDGTGLGLWVSKGILDNHNGRIAVRSKRGHGTVFRVLLPLDAMGEVVRSA